MTSSAIDCDVTNRTKTERVGHRDNVKRSSFSSSFMDSLCRVRNKIIHVLSWRTVSALTWVLFWYLFPSLLRNSGNKHQNNLLVSAETVRHSGTLSFSICSSMYIIAVQTIGIHYGLFQYNCTKMLNYVFSHCPKMYIFIIWRQSFSCPLQNLNLLRGHIALCQ